jgi:hypothetical protein
MTTVSDVIARDIRNMAKSSTSSGKGKKNPALPRESTVVALAASGTTIGLCVRMWTEQGYEAPPMALAMIEDLLAASPCEVKDRTPLKVTATFQDVLASLNTARRLQRLVQGYSRTSSDRRLGGCFVVFSAEDANYEVEAFFPHILSEMRLKEDSQIWFVGNLCRSVRTIPGLHFETASDTATVLRLMPFRREDNIGEPDLWVPPPNDRPQTSTVDNLAITSIEDEISAIHAYESPIIPLAPAPVLETVAAVEEKASPTIGTSSGTRFPKLWLLMGGTAAVIVVAVAMIVSHFSKSQAPVGETGNRNSSVKTGQPTTTETIPSSQTTPPAVSSTDKPTSHDKGPETPPRRDNPSTRQTRVTKDESGSGKPDTSRVGGIVFTAAEINSLIEHADKDSGDGKFDDAISKYQTVLKREPTNARALEGLERARRNRSRNN